MFSYALATAPTPILNRPDFSYVFGGSSSGILLNENHLLHSLEMIAFPGTVFEVIQEHSLFPHIYEVKTEAYPIKKALYIDDRFVKFYSKKPPSTLLSLPSSKDILKKMESLLGFPYVWGGNYSQGIDDMLSLYPPKKDQYLSSLAKVNWTFKGVDCSGILYEATQGLSPRNSSWLACYGKGVSIEGLTHKNIEAKLKPLDMLIWHGHVLFVFDTMHTIESRALQGNVFITKLSERLEQIEREEKKKPMNTSKTAEYKEKGFVIRRWHPEFF